MLGASQPCSRQHQLPKPLIFSHRCCRARLTVRSHQSSISTDASLIGIEGAGTGQVMEGGLLPTSGRRLPAGTASNKPHWRYAKSSRAAEQEESIAERACGGG
jgi:hypothetical protein